MAKCTAQVRVEGAQHFRLGDPVRGSVVIDVDEDVRADKVDVELLWRTHGRGDIDREVCATVSLPGGPWHAGRTVSLPFELVLPREGPVTTRGTLVNLDWYVCARVDLPWALDVKAENDVIVETDGAVFRSRDTLNTAEEKGTAPVTAQLGCVLGLSLFMVPFFVGAASFLAPAVLALARGKSPLGELPFALGGVLFGLIPSVMLYKVWHAYLGHRFLAGAAVNVDPSVADAGEMVRVRFTVPKNGDRVEAVRATLIGRERARYTSGTDKVTATHELHKAELSMHREGGAWAGRAPIPGYAASSFETRNNAIEWLIELTATVRGAPDPSFTRRIDVRAAPRRSADG